MTDEYVCSLCGHDRRSHTLPNIVTIHCRYSSSAKADVCGCTEWRPVPVMLRCAICNHTYDDHFPTRAQAYTQSTCVRALPSSPNICGCPVWKPFPSGLADTKPMSLDQIQEVLTGRLNTIRYSDNKLALDQIPPEALTYIAQVFSMGQRKYGRDNWKLGTNWHEFYGSALRHLVAFWKGEWSDNESGLPHLAHVCVNCIFLIYYHDRKKGVDDRDILAVDAAGTEAAQEKSAEQGSSGQG